MPRILITGGAGFIGSHTARALVELGHEVVCLDAFRHHSPFVSPTFAENIAYRMDHLLDGAELVRVDIHYPTALRRQLQEIRPEYVIHMASVSSAEAAFTETEGPFESIVRVTASLLEACRELNPIPKFVYVSSSMVYGDFTESPIREESPKQPKEMYGGFKLMAEVLTETFGKRFGLPYSIVRPSAVYGPGNNNGSVLQRFVENATVGAPISVTDPGRTVLDFTHVRDLAGGIARLTLSPAANGEAFNLTRGQGRTLLEAVGIIRTYYPHLQTEVKAERTDVRAARGALDIAKAQRLVGYSPRFGLEDGLRDYLAFVRAHNTSLCSRPRRDTRADQPSKRNGQPAHSSGRTEIPLASAGREFTTHRSEILRRIEAVLETGQTVNGAAVNELEARLARLTSRKHAIAVNSCTDALHFALVAAGIRKSDEVLVTDFSFISSASAIMLAGARPVFVDVDDTYNMSFERAAEHCTSRTRGLVFVHLYGQMSDPKRLEQFARRHDLVLVEDAAQALGASFGDRPAGSTGLVSCLSFNTTKTISAPGGGGAVLTDDDRIAERVRRLRCHGKTTDGSFKELGHYSIMPTATAAVLDFKLDHDSAWQQRRREIVSYFRERWDDCETLALPPQIASSVHTYHKFVVRSLSRTPLAEHLNRARIQSDVHYPVPLHRIPVFNSSRAAKDDGNYPEATHLAETVLTVPAHHCLSDAEVEIIANTVRQLVTVASPAIRRTRRTPHVRVSAFEQAAPALPR